MNSGRYQLKEFFKDHNLDQLIIPEIQRDYVWKRENVLKLLESIKLNEDRQADPTLIVTDAQLNGLSQGLREILIREIEKKKHYSNIGFIYAYNDRSFSGRYMLIDGQQRMTTLFLLLLSISIQEGQQTAFRQVYIKNGLPKVDYKVREGAHDFLVNFVNHMLNGGTLEEVKEQHWYFKEYEHDPTINSLYDNYQTIREYLTHNRLTLAYIEEYIEFWYFDTNKSQQGEELYIYMNSRGESVRSSESIKANLLKGLSETDKHHWGSQWEKWQDLFWKNRGLGQSADNGFEEFLRWIKIISYITDNLQESQASPTTWIRTLRENKKVTEAGLSLLKIEQFITALEVLINFRTQVGFKIEWLHRQPDAVDYIWLLPTLMYAKRYPTCTSVDLKRYARLFFNSTRFEILTKNPYTTIIAVVKLSQTFLAYEFTDVTALTRIDRNNKSLENILTPEVTTKLELYNANIHPAGRVRMEKLFWEAEDYTYCNGRIAFLWRCMEYKSQQDGYTSFDLDLFEDCFSAFKLLFDQPDDLLRRALLTKGDYSVYDGRTATLEGDRFSFIQEGWRWQHEIGHKGGSKIYIDLVQDFMNRKAQDPVLNREEILNRIITAYLSDNENQEHDWMYYTIRYKEVLAYCRQKFMCFSGGTVFLLQDMKAAQYNWVELAEHLNIQSK